MLVRLCGVHCCMLATFTAMWASGRLLQRVFDLELDNECNFELLMKVYGNVGRLEDAERMRLMMVDRGLDS
ncbi:hypothetical protein TB1_041045 [Malus domestica]